MRLCIRPSVARGKVMAPPSKSMAHRYLIGAALSQGVSVLSGVDYSEDILATMDCLKALGAEIAVNGDVISVDSKQFMKTENPVLHCRESGSTLRFFIPLCLCLGRKVVFTGSTRLLERPLSVYEDLCRDRGFFFEKNENSLTVCGTLSGGTYKIRGDISSQFITGMIFALLYLGKDSQIEIMPPFESRSYVNLTISALQSFGADVGFTDAYTVSVKSSELHGFCGSIEGDYSNAAFLDAFNLIGSKITVNNLKADSLQGDKIYREYFRKIGEGNPTLDISDCPDLGPVLFALAALKNGAVFTGTDRLKAKESDRGMAMHEELLKLGGGLVFSENSITVPKQELQYHGSVLDSHNDHRIVMALSVILSKIGGEIRGIEAVGKSYPDFFNDIKALGAEVIINDCGCE